MNLEIHKPFDESPKMAHKIIRPKEYTPAHATNVAETMAKHRCENQTTAPIVQLIYPIKVQ